MDALIAGELAIVPAVWRLEVVNSLVVAERRKKIHHFGAEAFLQRLQPFRIEVDTAGLDWTFSSTLELAREYQRSAYDASYLELARRTGFPLATKDEPLRQAAREIGIEIFAPGN
jgi:predicted nucleic acid-binding protein